MMALRPAFALVLLQQPDYPLADFVGAAKSTLHRLLALPVQASAAAVGIDDLQYVEFLAFGAIGTVIFLVVGWSVIRYRRRATDPAAPVTPRVRAPLWLELGVAGSLLTMFFAWWVVGFKQYASLQYAPPDALDVYVTAKQWVWKFAYEDGPQSAGVLYVPEGRPVRLLLTSRDVIHSFFVPEFRLKQDAVPGRYTTVWFRPTRTGRYRILCAEYCGAGHSRMWAEVAVLPADRFERWLASGAPDLEPDDTEPEPAVISPDREAPRPRATLADRGLRVAAEQGCLRCHSTDGTPHIGPTWRGLYGARVPLEGGDTVVADPAYLTESMMDPQARIVEGYGPLMPSFQGLLTPAEAAALIEYIKSIGRTP